MKARRDVSVSAQVKKNQSNWDKNLQSFDWNVNFSCKLPTNNRVIHSKHRTEGSDIKPENREYTERMRPPEPHSHLISTYKSRRREKNGTEFYKNIEINFQPMIMWQTTSELKSSQSENSSSHRGRGMMTATVSPWCGFSDASLCPHVGFYSHQDQSEQINTASADPELKDHSDNLGKSLLQHPTHHFSKPHTHVIHAL